MTRVMWLYVDFYLYCFSRFIASLSLCCWFYFLAILQAHMKFLTCTTQSTYHNLLLNCIIILDNRKFRIWWCKKLPKMHCHWGHLSSGWAQLTSRTGAVPRMLLRSFSLDVLQLNLITWYINIFVASVLPDPLSPLITTHWFVPFWTRAWKAASAIANICGRTVGSPSFRLRYLWKYWGL